MSLFELPIPLLASSICYLDCSSLASLDSAVCNQTDRSILLEAFKRSSAAYGGFRPFSFQARYDLARMAWLVRRRFKVASIDMTADYCDNFFTNEDFKNRLWSLFTAEDSVVLTEIFELDSSLLKAIGRVKLLQCQAHHYDPQRSNLLYNFALTSPVSLILTDNYNGEVLRQYLSDHRILAFISELRVIYDSDNPINNLTQPTQARSIYPVCRH